MMLNRRSLMAAALILPLGAAMILPCWGQSAPVYSPGGVAIGGYDPVAYFTEGRAVLGDGSHMLKWRGTMWIFASAANLEAFEMDPKAFAPQYGGYCAYGIAQGQKIETDPKVFTISNGRLYFNNSSSAKSLWQQDIATNISRADANWPALAGQ